MGASGRTHRVDMSAAAVTAKAAAIAAFESQIAPLGPADADAPILPAHVLAHFTRPFETVFV